MAKFSCDPHYLNSAQIKYEQQLMFEHLQVLKNYLLNQISKHIQVENKPYQKTETQFSSTAFLQFTKKNYQKVAQFSLRH